MGLSLSASVASAARVSADPPLGKAIAVEINTVRAEHALARLRTAPQLARAALAHASSMGRLGYFSHSSADGSSSEQRITSFYRVRGGSGWAVGEVIIWVTGRLTAAQAVAAWLASPPHRGEILSRRWREVGVGAVYVPQAAGVFGGRDVTIAVVDFSGRRRSH
jgi:uncharacterized protein YkwD